MVADGTGTRASGGWLIPRRLVELRCGGPAGAFGITGKGTRTLGADADLVLVRPVGSIVKAALPVRRRGRTAGGGCASTRWLLASLLADLAPRGRK